MNLFKSTLIAAPAFIALAGLILVISSSPFLCQGKRGSKLFLPTSDTCFPNHFGPISSPEQPILLYQASLVEMPTSSTYIVWIVLLLFLVCILFNHFQKVKKRLKAKEKYLSEKIQFSVNLLQELLEQKTLKEAEIRIVLASKNNLKSIMDGLSSKSDLLEQAMPDKIAKEEKMEEIHSVSDSFSTYTDDQIWLKNLEKVILRNLSNAHFDVVKLAEKMHVSERGLYYKVKSITSETPAKYIRKVRLLKAKELLERREVKSVAEVCYAVGFKTPTYFAKLFKTQFGEPPSSFL